MSNYTKGTVKYEATITAPTTEATTDVTNPDVTYGGHLFDYWYDSSNPTDQAKWIKPNQTGWMPDSDLTLTAKWKAITYKIHFLSGTYVPSGQMPDETYAYNETKAISHCTYTYEGYTFNKWAADPVVGSHAVFSDGQNINLSDLMKDNVDRDTATATLTLTAIWSGRTNTAYTVNHYQEALDGTYPETPTEVEHLTGTTDENTRAQAKSYPGFTLKAQPVQQKIKADGSTTIDIQYTRNAHTLNWNAGGGTFTE